MVFVMGQNQIANTLHLVCGMETDVAMAVNGTIVLDITPALKQMDTEKTVVLHMSRCPSEQKFVADMQSAIAAGASYPFFPPIIVFGPKAAVDALTPDTTPNEPKHAKAEPIVGECLICHSHKSELVPKLDPKICYDCARIELGLKRTAKKKPAGEAPHA